MFAVSKYAGMPNLPSKPKDLAAALGISIPYASQLLTGARLWTRPLALRVFRATGAKVGPIAAATDDEIAVLTRFEPPQEAAAA